MSQIRYRANLSAKSFPFLSENWGQSIIIPAQDQVYNPRITSPEDADKDIGIPQIFYCHNVLPYAQGFQSIGYQSILPPNSPEVGNFSIIHFLRDDQDNKAYLGITKTGGFFINNGVNWTYKTNYGTGQVTLAYVSGITYIWIDGYGCVKYDFTTGLFVGVTLTGLSIPDIHGIAPSFGYLIAWSIASVAWSSTIDPTDFTPSLTTGAGSGSIEGAKGAITFCLPHTLGFMVYTTSNVVVAIYSGNARYPFNFREIVSSGGCASAELVSYDANTGNHYAYTTSGLQLISTNVGQTIFPEVTDFISGQLFEDFDESTYTFTSTPLSQALAKKITVVSDRYLIISYGITALTHALVYDLTQKRWGKLKVDHVDAFEFQLTNPGVFEIPKQSIAFLKNTGEVVIITFAITNSSGNGIVFLGKYQYVRSRLMELQEVWMENVHGANFTCRLYSALDGKNAIWNDPDLMTSAGLLRQMYFRKAAMNHSLLFKGSFNLSSLELVFNIHGKR